MWSYANVRIYVQEKDKNAKQIMARLNTIGGSTILHRFGQDAPIQKLQAYVLTDTDMDALEALLNSSTSYELVGPEGSLGDWVLNDISGARQKSVHHVFYDRPGEDVNVPLYLVSMELYIDD